MTQQTTLLSLALAYLKADCCAEFGVHEKLTAANCKQFGAEGKDAVMVTCQPS